MVGCNIETDGHTDGQGHNKNNSKVSGKTYIYQNELNQILYSEEFWLF